MANKKVSLLGLITVAVLAVVMARNANAYFDGGSEDSNGGGGGSCQDYNLGYNYCTRFKAWYYYEYKDGIDYGSVKVKADGAGINYGSFNRTTSITVGRDCDNNSSGFYVSGLILWDDTKGNQYSSADDVIADTDIWTESGGGWSQHWIGVAKYDPSSSSSYLTKRLNINWKPSDGTNYIKRVKTVPASEVEQAWNDYGREYALSGGKSGDLTDYSWFCAGDKAKKQEQYYTGKSFIRLSDNADSNLKSSTNELASCKSDGSSSKTCTKKITDGSGTKRIYYMAAGLVGKDGSKAISDDYEEFEGTKFDLYNANANNSDTAISGTARNGIEGSIRDSSYHYNYDYDSAKHVAYFDMNPGDKKTICSVNNYHTHYKDGAYDDTKNKVSACVKLEYALDVAAVDSDTVATVDGVSYSSRNANNKADDSYTSASVIVSAGEKTVSWAHYMGWTSRSDGGLGNINAKVYDFSGSDILAGPISIGAYSVPGIPGGYNLKYYTTDSVSMKYPYGSKTTVSFDNTEKTGVFPGEHATVSQSNYHPSKVEIDSGNPASGSEKEHSSVTLNLYANDIKCGLEDGEWGNSGAHMKNIGVDNPYDYRWLRFQRNGSNSVIVGDDFGNSATMWFNPKDKIRVYQKACFGTQIAKDASNVSENRWDVNPWGSNRDDTANNTKFELSTPQALKNRLIWGNGNNKLNNQAWLQSTGSASLVASEIGVSRFRNDEESTPRTRIETATPYEISTESLDDKMIGNAGMSLTTEFKKPNGESASITANIPYNYYLETGFQPSTDNNILTGNTTKFVSTITNKPRINVPVNGTNPYATATKRTTASMLLFTVKDGFDLTELSAINGDFVLGGDATNNEIVLENAVKGKMGEDYQSPISNSYQKVGPTMLLQEGSTMPKMTSIEVDYSGYPVGTKICAAIAVYPSDSHGTANGSAITNSTTDGQKEALTDSGTKTKVTVSCRTVAKYQTFSVEGNGIIGTGGVYSGKVVYSDSSSIKRTFRSWSEYQVIADSSDVASGAVTAYGLNYPATAINERKNISQYSVKDGSMLYPQSLGNHSLATISGELSNPNSADEATSNMVYMQGWKDRIIQRYGTIDGTCREGDSGNNTLICKSSDIALNNSMVNLPNKDTIVVRSLGTITIQGDISIPSSSRQLIIIAKNINIDPNVGRVDAWLIADGGTLNTCTGNSTNYKVKVGSTEKYDGNQHLLDNCYNSLVINGPVMVDNGSIVLPRSYGGGSKKVGDSIEKDEESLGERAEIFNFDPSIVEWAYNESKKNPQITTDYIETIAPKL